MTDVTLPVAWETLGVDEIEWFTLQTSTSDDLQTCSMLIGIFMHIFKLSNRERVKMTSDIGRRDISGATKNDIEAFGKQDVLVDRIIFTCSLGYDTPSVENFVQMNPRCLMSSCSFSFRRLD